VTAKRDPWMKFYPSDWRADPAVHSCSMSARGLWVEMLCLMHEATPRGSLLINGQQVSGKQLAGLCGAGLNEIVRLLGELAGAGVFSRDSNGTIYSRRMRRDDEKAARDKENGKAGGNPKLLEGVNPPHNGGDKAQKPEARSQRLEVIEGTPFSHSNSDNISSEKSGGKAAASWTPARHGATSKAKGRIYVETGTPEWEAYSEDFREAHGIAPEPNQHGGKWFNIAGERRHPGAA
jgi:hypothetical protein